MQGDLLVRNARQLLTLPGPPTPRAGAAARRIGALENAGMLIRGGIVIEVGHSRRVERLRESRDASEIDARGMIVIPAFVDPWVTLEPFRAAPDWERENVRRLNLMARHGTASVGVRCAPGPESSLWLRRLARRVAPALHPAVETGLEISGPGGGIDESVPFALSTRFDWPISPLLSMTAVVQAAAARVSIEAALVAATHNAACALGIEGATGSLVPGKHADFAILDLADYRDLPLLAGANPVVSLFRSGRQVVPA